MLEVVLGSWDIALNKTDEIHALVRLIFYWGVGRKIGEGNTMHIK